MPTRGAAHFFNDVVVVIDDALLYNSPPGTPAGFSIQRAAVFAETPDMVVPSAPCTQCYPVWLTWLDV